MKILWSELHSDNAEAMNFTTPLPGEEIFDLAPPSCSKVLDVGCGYARVLKHMQDLGYNDLTGVDVSEELISRARIICPNASYLVQDIEDLCLDGKYDLILVMGVIEYILSDENQRIFFKKISQALSPDGHVLLETFVIDKQNFSSYLNGLFKTGHWGRFVNGKGFECHHQSFVTIDKLIEEYFEVESRIRRRFKTWSGDKCNGYSLTLTGKTYLIKH